MDFLSRHPALGTDDEGTEGTVKHFMEDEHTVPVILDRVTDQTNRDHQLKKVSQRIMGKDWEKHGRDPNINPFYNIRQQLYAVEDLILGDHKIVVPTTLQRKVVCDAHSMGLMGMTKSKEMLRQNKFKKMFAMHGAPNRIESDNRPSSNSIDFEHFALKEGFNDRKVPLNQTSSSLVTTCC